MQLSYNAPIQTIEEPRVITGGRVDIFSPELTSIRLSHNPQGGIIFRADGKEIPYNETTVNCTDGIAGRMLYVQDTTSSVRIYLVEHLVSALGSAGIYDALIDVEENCYAPSFSFFSREDNSSRSKPIRSYCIPIPGPGIRGFTKSFVGHIVPSCTSAGRDIITCTNQLVHQVTDPDKKYQNIERIFQVDPSDSFHVTIRSSRQPDTGDVLSEHSGICLQQGDDLGVYSDARPVARVTNWTSYLALCILRHRSQAITPATYFMATPLDNEHSLRMKMRPRYQHEKNEHLYHTAVSDLISELVQKFGSAILHMDITITDSNHRFRLEALNALHLKGAFQRTTTTKKRKSARVS